MRTVSSFSPGAAGTELGRTEADKAGEPEGVFGGAKELADETSSPSEIISGECGEEIGGPPVSRTGNSIRMVSFFGRSGSPVTVGVIDQKSCELSVANLATQANGID